jgi:hypothetical protein
MATLACLFVALQPSLALAGGPVFSHMTLNGITAVGLSVEDVVPELAPYGMTAETLGATVANRLESAGLPVVDAAEAAQNPMAALLRVRIITNRNAQGFYHLSVKLEVRKKIPLGNPAGGFISEAIWSSADNGVMLANETEKIGALLKTQLDGFIADFTAQNAAQ